MVAEWLFLMGSSSSRRRVDRGSAGATADAAAGAAAAAAAAVYLLKLKPSRNHSWTYLVFYPWLPTRKERAPGM